jgi:hypothetical protein
MAIAVGVEGSAVHFDEHFADGEAEAEAAEAAGDFRAALLEGREEVGEGLGVDADAGVGDLEEDFAGMSGGASDGDGSAWGSELDGVFDEIPECLLEAFGVGVEVVTGGLGVEIEAEVFGCGIRGADGDGLGEEGGGIDDLEFEFEFSVADAGEIEEIVDDPGGDLDISADHGDLVVDVLGEVFTSLHCGDAHEDWGEGGAEFVGQVCEEGIFFAIGGFGVLSGLVDGLSGLFAVRDIDGGAGDADDLSGGIA